MRNSSSSSFLNDLLSAICSDSTTTNASLAHILTHLAEREVVEGGPYVFDSDTTNTDLDFGFNLAIAVFLDTYDVQLPNLEMFITERLERQDHSSTALDAEIISDLVQRYQVVRATTKIEPEIGTVGTLLTEEESSITNVIMQACDRRLKNLPDAFTVTARRVLTRTIRGNSDKQMSLMPFFMREALGSEGKVFSNDYVAECGLANAFFWTAFIVYDDFWDEDESAEPVLLPVANLFARHYIRFFSEILPLESGFVDFLHTSMDSLDAANEWEMLSCRLVCDGRLIHVPDELPSYGDFGIKFYPAAGHVLGPIAMLVHLGHAIDSVEVENLVNYFRHYLISMQLNDDAHDWKEDLIRGNYSTAVSILLSVWKKTYPDRNVIDIDADMPELERLFWFEVLEPVSMATLDHTRQSRHALESLKFIANPEPLEQFIIHNERIAQQALDELHQSSEFLQAMSDSVLSPVSGI